MSSPGPSALREPQSAAGLGGLVGPDGRPLLRVSSTPVVGPAIDRAILDRATDNLAQSFDPAHGGWGGAPKFPAPMTIEHLLRRFVRAGDVQALTMARRTLDAMAAGGIYDQLGGGFARYATDAVWLVPHFEKMLYDNALLARAYLHAWQVTAEPRYHEVVEDTLDYLLREMTVPGGAFAASQDADTDGEEGATYVWTADEIRAVLGSAEAALFADAYDVTEGGNWEGKTILRRVRDDVALAARHAIAAEQVAERLADARARLVEARRARPQPARDDKALAAWNGLAIAALAEAAVALSRPDYAAAATAAAAALWDAPEDGGGPPAAVMEGRPGEARGGPRGPRGPRRRSAGALRGDLRAALVPGRRRARGAHRGPLRGPGRRLVRHGRRPRGARRPAQEPPGQRAAERRRDGRRRAAAAGGTDGRSALSVCRRGRGGGLRAARRQLPERLRVVAGGGGSGRLSDRRGRDRRLDRASTRRRSWTSFAAGSVPASCWRPRWTALSRARTSRCSATDRSSRAGRRPTSVAASPARHPTTSPDGLAGQLGA